MVPVAPVIAQRACSKAKVHQAQKNLNPNTIQIPLPPVITDITLAFIFYMCWISIVSSLYFTVVVVVVVVIVIVIVVCTVKCNIWA
jgi:hypothetical protein